jgi:hypothetical protein
MPMSEEEWLACVDPSRMLEFLKGKTNERKLRLFAVACFRSASHLALDGCGWEAVEVLEQRAEGSATVERIRRASTQARHAYHEIRAIARDEPAWARAFAYLVLYRLLASSQAEYAALDSHSATNFDHSPAIESATRSEAAAARCQLVREVFGNPFRPAAVAPAWRTWNVGTVIQLAEMIYEKRAFVHLPVLADALEEAGCDNPAMLEHCRGGGEHVRGCWVIDLILGRA